jgi:hypothetical protein
MGARENKITFYMSEEQKADLEKRASRSGLTVSNYLRSLLGWPLERQGARKDLITKQAKTRGKRRG